MFKRLVTILAFGCYALQNNAANDLTIPANGNYTVTTETAKSHYETLTIGDNAVITFAPTVKFWELNAEQARIGKNVVIDARGASGEAGSAGENYSNKAKACEAGKTGLSGDNGGPAGNARDLFLNLNIDSLGSMKILADGGKGGDGGNGGAGQNAGDTDNCKPADGGQGGKGGSGGNGGNGSKVVLALSSIGEQSTAELISSINVSVNSGEGGNGGNGGAGGEGSEGRYVQQKTLTGNRKWQAGGDKGSTGSQGENGSNGQPGHVFIQNTAAPATTKQSQPSKPITKPKNTLKPEKPAAEVQPSKDAEIKLLKEQLRLLQQRMEKLESQ